MKGLQIFFKIAQSAIFALLLTGCAHSVSSDGSPQDTPSLNQPIGGLSGKTFNVVKVNDYVLPKEPPHIKVRFENGEIHLVGTCNPTWGHYELTGGVFTLNAMGNAGQNACTELVEMPDGSTNERIARTPNVITEYEFIKIGEESFKIQWYPNETHFIDSSGSTLIILEH